MELTLIKSIYDSKKINIEYLVTEADELKIEQLKKNYDIKNIISRDQFHKIVNQKKTIIDYDIVERFNTSQLNSEHYQDRFSDDINLKQYHYFNALSFWIDVFNISNISAIILDGLMHGANYDSLALDVAKDFGIPAYVIEDHMFKFTQNGTLFVRSVLDYNLNKRVPLNLSKLNLKPIKINDYFYYIDKNESAIKKEKLKNIKSIIKFIMPKYFFTFIHILGYIIRKKRILHHGLNSNPIKVLRNIFYIKKMKKYYDSISVELDSSKILFFMPCILTLKLRSCLGLDSVVKFQL